VAHQALSPALERGSGVANIGSEMKVLDCRSRLFKGRVGLFGAHPGKLNCSEN
jgi:hypothetical protein